MKSVSQANTAQLSALDLSLSDEGVSQAELQQHLSWIESSSVPTHSVRFMNQLFAGVHEESLLADQLASKSRTTLATREASPIFSKIEDEVVSALCREIGWSSAVGGGVAVPGGSMANFMGLHLARIAHFPESKEAGLSGGSRLVVFVSADAHYSLKKAALVLGLGTDAVIPVRTSSQGKMDPLSLKQNIEAARARGDFPLAVVATSGTTVYGAFDPLEEVHSIAKNEGLWLHVDAAWGGPALFSNQLRSQIKGIHLADSVTFDAHKFFGSSLTSSFLLTRHRELLLSANDVSGGDYLFHPVDSEVGLDLGRISWQCGRGPDALAFWVLWKSLGRSGLARMTDRLLCVRDELVSYIPTESRLRLVVQPSYLNVCIYIEPPMGAKPDVRDWAVVVRDQLMQQKKAWVNYARDSEGRAFLRMILVHPKLTFVDAKEILREALGVGA